MPKLLKRIFKASCGNRRQPFLEACHNPQLTFLHKTNGEFAQMKKYNNLHPPIIERISQEERLAKNPDKATKTRLHQIYGAYIRPNSNKKAAILLKQLICTLGARLASTAVHESATTNRASPTPTENVFAHEHTITNLLKLHYSTNERLPFYSDFYDFIFSHTGAVNKVLDLGCGYNPFSLPFFPQKPIEYHAIDIDLHTKDLLNLFFELMDMPKNAACEDLETITPQVKTDLTLMLKLFPVLEANNPGRAYSLANDLNTTWLVVTFPTKSLGGKKKGMTTSYKKNFQDAIDKDNLNNFTLIAESTIGNELVFVLRNSGGK